MARSVSVIGGENGPQKIGISTDVGGRLAGWKALAARVAAAAVFTGGVFAVSNWLHPSSPPSQQIVLPPGTTITVPAAPPASPTR